jgi:hypothetical protein
LMGESCWRCGGIDHSVKQEEPKIPWQGLCVCLFNVETSSGTYWLRDFEMICMLVSLV